MEFFEKKFKNYEEFKDQFEDYQTESFQTYSVRTSVAINEHDPLSKIFKYSKIVYLCKHGVKARTKTKDNTRPNQHSYYTGCKSSLTIKFDKKENVLMFHDSKIEHNHAVKKEVYQSYTHIKTKKLKEHNFIDFLF